MKVQRERLHNTGNALSVAGLLRKYLDAQGIASHAVLTPEDSVLTHTRVTGPMKFWRRSADFYREFVDSADLGVGSVVGNLNVHDNTRIGIAAPPAGEIFCRHADRTQGTVTGKRTIKAVARSTG